LRGFELGAGGVEKGGESEGRTFGGGKGKVAGTLLVEASQ